MPKTKGTATLSITAFIDLLGFSSHLELSGFDLRTDVGMTAYKRLEIIEEALSLFEKEKKKYKNIYPQEIRVQRFNDALIFGIDLIDEVAPKIGDSNVKVAWSWTEIIEYNKGNFSPEIFDTFSSNLDKEALKISLFVGVVNRVHRFINRKEKEINMPGCRTVISSGLRFRFYDRKGNEDYNSANFSFTNAYIVNDYGSKKGFEGNNLFMDENVAQILAINKHIRTVLIYSSYVTNSMNPNPYDSYSGYPNKEYYYTISKQIPIRLFGKDYVFRELNTIPLSTYQLLPELLKTIDSDNVPPITKNFNLNLKREIFSVDKINTDGHHHVPLLFVEYPLEGDYNKTINIFKNQNL